MYENYHRLQKNDSYLAPKTRKADFFYLSSMVKTKAEWAKLETIIKIIINGTFTGIQIAQ